MSFERDRIRLTGFNNLTKTVRFNVYDFFVARTASERRAHARRIDQRYSAARITEILRGVAPIIDARILSVSGQDYEPQGASALLLMGEEQPRVEPTSERTHDGPTATSVAAHLTKSHLCAHTYPDCADSRGICCLRIDVDMATCGTILPLRALNYLFEHFDPDVAVIDYVVRGFTRDSAGRHVYLDHPVRSIQDFLDPELLRRYRCEDLSLTAGNMWQTKLLRTSLDTRDALLPVVDSSTSENRETLALLEREMAAVYHGWPS